MGGLRNKGLTMLFCTTNYQTIEMYGNVPVIDFVLAL